jgi:hypothetical protein
VIENFLGFDAVQRKKTKQKMAGLAGFEPAPHVVAVGVVERVAHFLAHLFRGSERY